MEVGKYHLALISFQVQEGRDRAQKYSLYEKSTALLLNYIKDVNLFQEWL